MTLRPIVTFSASSIGFCKPADGGPVAFHSRGGAMITVVGVLPAVAAIPCNISASIWTRPEIVLL